MINNDAEIIRGFFMPLRAFIYKASRASKKVVLKNTDKFGLIFNRFKLVFSACVNLAALQK